MRELICDGENGFLIDPDARFIAGRLEQLATDPRLAKRLGEAARQAALGFRWEDMVRRHSELYERLAARPGPAPNGDAGPAC